jgi:hypothetical protein
MIAGLLLLLSAPSLKLSEFAPLVFESKILRNWDVINVGVGREALLRWKISAHWWARGDGKAIEMIDIHLLVQPERESAKDVLVKWSSSGQAGSYDLEKAADGRYGNMPITRGCVIREAPDNVAAMVTLTGNKLDKAAVTLAGKLADEALALGEGFVRGKRAKAQSIASRGAAVASFDPNIQFVSASMCPVFINSRGNMSPNPRSNNPNDPHYPATLYSWGYAGAQAYPYISSRIIVFDDVKLATDVAGCLPAGMFGDCPQRNRNVTTIYVDARTGKRLPDPTTPNDGPLYRSSAHWGYVARSGKAVLSCEYMLAGYKADPAQDKAFSEQAKKTLALAEK